MQELVKSGLKPNAELFCQYFAETRNATQSYKKAYAKNRPTNKSCAVLGHKLLRSIKVRHRIEALMAPRPGVAWDAVFSLPESPL